MHKFFKFNDKNKFIFFLLFICISHTYSNNSSYVTFDLKKFINYSINYDEPSDLILYNLYSYYYTYITFGFPKKNYLMQISLDEFDLDLTNYKCNINSNYSNDFFDPFLSNSSKVEISGIHFPYYGLNNIYRITDHIKLYQNETSNLIFPKIVFLFNPRNYSIAKIRNDFSPFTCFKTGLRLPIENIYLYENYSLNILGQLYRNKIINSYEWFIEYNNESNAKLIIGVSPYEYNKKKYSYNNSKSIKGIFFNGEFFYWNLEFTQIYFLKNNKREQFDYRKVSFEPSLNFIKAPIYYFQFINETLFNKFFNEKKCFIKEMRKQLSLLSIYYCENTPEVKNEIKNKFININLLHRFLEKEFVLDYNDLFLEKKNKIYFLIIYDNMIRNNWIFGKPFLKKYFFTFNYEEKLMTYYEIINSDIKEENNDNNAKNKKIILIVVIVVLVIVFGLLGFFLAKYIYKYKKRKATELTEDIDNDNISDEENKKIVEPIFENNDN